MVDVLADMTYHFMGGLAASGLDYVTHWLASKPAKRMVQKRKCLESIDAILDAHKEEGGPSLDPTSVEYGRHIYGVGNYFRRKGLVKMDAGIGARTLDFVYGLIHDEKLNNSDFRGKVAWTLFIEFGFDTMQLMQHTESPVQALGYNIWQMPSFLAGLYVGKIGRNFADWCVTPKAEFEMDKTITHFIEESPIVALVTEYTAPESVLTALSAEGIKEFGTSLTRTGSKYLAAAQTAAGDLVDDGKEVLGRIVNIPDRMRQQKEQQEAERKARFDELTKDK